MEEQMSLGDAVKSLGKAKAIFEVDRNNPNSLVGRVVYISKSIDTYDEMLEEFRKRKLKAEHVMIIGNYA